MAPRGAKLSDYDINAILTELTQSIDNADIIGLPMGMSGRKNGLSAANAVFGIPLRKWARIKNPDSTDRLTTANIHRQLARVDFLKKLLSSTNNGIYTISCHNLIGELNDKYNTNKFTENFHIPGEQRFVKDKGVHFPDRFTQLVEDLRHFVSPGQLFLVGGGALGKKCIAE